jgi:hypothetical protein
MADSGKTVLLRPWMGGADLAGHAAWVDAARNVHELDADQGPRQLELLLMRGPAMSASPVSP